MKNVIYSPLHFFKLNNMHINSPTFMHIVAKIKTAYGDTATQYHGKLYERYFSSVLVVQLVNSAVKTCL